MSLQDQVEHELLPTPRTTDAKGAGPHGQGSPDLRTAISLFPTPMVADARGARNSTANRRTIPPTGIHAGDTLTDAVSLLPTPSAAVVNDGEDPEQWQARHDRHAAKDNATRSGMPLTIAAQLLTVDGEHVEWGKYAGAIARTAAILGALPPAPAKPDGKGGKYRLFSGFVEWMMMLEPGWVCGHGLSRSQELARLGNGVVPIQAAVATATNLADLAAMKRAEVGQGGSSC